VTAAVIKTTCCYCGVGCGIEVRRDAGGRLSLRGDEQHPANFGMLCSKGRALLHVAEARGGRLTHPEMRRDRAQQRARVSWNDAIARAAATFARIRSEFGNDAVAVYASGQMLTEEYYILTKLVKGFLGTNNLDTNSRLCMSSAVAAYKYSLGADGPPIAYSDIECCDTFLICGANPAWCHPILHRRIEARKTADADVRIVVVDPRATASCVGADLHLRIKPGTDVALHHGLARQIAANGDVDHEFIAGHVDGWEELQRAIAPYTLERTAEICGLNAADIAVAASWLGGKRRFLSMWTMGLNQSAVGVDKNVSLINLSLITGKIGKPGCGPFSLTGQPNAMGGREVGGMANLLPAHRDLGNAEHRAEVARHWGVVDIPQRPGLTAVEQFEALRSGKLKAIWIIATNPVASLPDSWRVEEALAKAELVVVQDIVRTDTTAYADIVLPAATWLEKRGTMTNSERRMTLLEPALAPPGEALPDSDIFRRFAAASGWQASFDYKGPDDIFREYAELTRGTDIDCSGLDHERLRELRTVQWPVKSRGDTGTERLYTDHHFATPSGRARLAAVEFCERSEALDAQHPLILTTGRLRDQWHTMTKTGLVARLRQQAPVPTCEIHPDDAIARGISEGDIITVASRRGSVQVAARVTNDIRPGVACLPMHWSKLLGGDYGRTNNCTSPILDPVSKEPDLKFAAVEVSRYQPAPRRILVVGAGAAARAFIDAHGKTGLADVITVFGDESQPFYQRPLLPHYLSGQTIWSELVSPCATSPALTIHAGARIVAIDRAAKQATDTHGARHDYDLLVLATGSRAAKRHQGRIPERGVHYLRTRADADAIRAAATSGKRAVIIGAGLLGIELADALVALGVAVTIVQRGDRLMSRHLDAKSSRMLAQMLEQRGIKIRYRAALDEILGGHHAAGVLLDDKSTLPADLIIFATGTAPNAELARETVLRCSTGVIVDRHMMTSDPAIAAIGEVAEFEGRLAGTTAAVTVQAQALVERLRGNLHAPYQGPLDANILKVSGVLLATIGDSDPEGAAADTVIYNDASAGIYQKCVIADKRLVGAILIGDLAPMAELSELIASRIELDERRGQLLRGAPSRPVAGNLVCSCNQVGDETIRACAAGGADLASVCASTRAGTSCGSCRPEIKRLVQRVTSTASG
jgi:ferredoxin-nitrate reductase